jgi:hypothetical protein
MEPRIAHRVAQWWTSENVATGARRASKARVGLIGAALIAVLAGCSAGPSATPASPAPLVSDVSVPQHFYGARLPGGWTATLGATASDPDTFSGPEGTITIAFAQVPPGTGQEAWAAGYVDAQVVDFAPGCFIGQDAPSEDIRVGSEGALLFSLSCLPGWMAVTAYGDHGYDIRFTDASRSASPAGKDLFRSILLAMNLAVTPAATVGPS